jgi:hypothetical protein
MTFRCTKCLSTFHRKRNLTYHVQNCNHQADLIAEMEYIYNLMTEEQQKVIYDSLTNKRLKNKKPIKLSRRTAPPATTDEVKPKVVQEVQINNYVKNIFNFTSSNSTVKSETSLRELLMPTRKNS